MTEKQKGAADLHSKVPADWYARSIRENFLQRFWHTRRFEEIGKLVDSKGGSILDIGCADGTFTKVILDHSKAKKVIGIGVMKNSIEYAKKRFVKNKRLAFQVADAHRLPYKTGSFEAVFCLETLEHVEDPEGVILEMHRVLEDNGYVVVLVPTENFLFRFVVWPLWILGWGRIWKGTHLYSFSADQIVRKLEINGFKIKENRKFLFGMLQAVKAKKE